MLGILVILAIILVLILINKNTKRTPESPGCIEQGCAGLAIMLVLAVVGPECARNQQAQFQVERTQKQRSERVAPAPQVLLTDVTIADATNPSVHKTSYDASTSKIIVNCRVLGAAPRTPLTGKWFLLGSGTRQLLQEATFNAVSRDHPAFFSAARPSNQLWPVGTYEVELFAGVVLHKTLTFWVV